MSYFFSDGLKHKVIFDLQDQYFVSIIRTNVNIFIYIFNEMDDFYGLTLINFL